MIDETNETKSAEVAPVFQTVAQFCKRHPAFTMGGMRHLLFFNPGGVREVCTVRFGRRVLIDEDAFFAWLRANRERTNLFSNKAPTETSKPKKSSTPKTSKRATQGAS